MKLVRPLAIALLALVPACVVPSETGGPPGHINELPRALTPQEHRLIEADNRFAIKLLKHATLDTRDTLPNLFISPLSVAMALAMTYNGAAGTTEDAMRATLELDGMTVPEVNASYRSLIQVLEHLDSHVQFEIANSIWYKRGYTVAQPFLDANRTYYDAQVTALDFASPTAPVTINDWVSAQTHGLIDHIIDPPIPDYQRLYLIDAIYFKGDWTVQFDKELTQPRPFYQDDGSTIDVPTMSRGLAKLRSNRLPNALVIDLPYGGEAFSMTIVVPDDTSSVERLVDGLTPAQWNAWTDNLHSVEAEVRMPKFKLKNDLNLIPTLDALGMGIAFSDIADFSRIHTPSELAITEVKHATYVDVNEEGTVAAAVTVVGVGLTSAGPSVFVIDRPFLFALRENLSGTILFLGVIRRPPMN